MSSPPLSQEQLDAIFRATGKLPPGYENAWRLLQWRPEARISAAAALRHPALSLGGVEAAAGSTGRELVMSS